MTERRLLTPCLLVSLLLVAIVGCSKPATENSAEKPTVQGRWFGFESGSTQTISLTFAGDRFSYSDAQSNEIGSGTFVMNDRVQPNQMDLTFEKIPAPDYVGKVALSIYELQGAELKIAGAEPGSTTRPTTIAGGQGIRTFTFKRE